MQRSCPTSRGQGPDPGIRNHSLLPFHSLEVGSVGLYGLGLGLPEKAVGDHVHVRVVGVVRHALVEGDEFLTKNGHIPLPNKPGLGVEINEEAMRKYATPGIPFFE